MYSIKEDSEKNIPFSKDSKEKNGIESNEVGRNTCRLKHSDVHTKLKIFQNLMGFLQVVGNIAFPDLSGYGCENHEKYCINSFISRNVFFSDAIATFYVCTKIH